MMKFDGVHEFDQPAAEVWDKLTDARYVVPCLPDLDAVKEIDADHAVCTIKPGFSFVRGTLEMTVRIFDRVPGRAAKMVMDSKGIGTSSTVEASFVLEPREGGGCRMNWTAEVAKLGGLLKAAPTGLLQGAASRVLEQAWRNVQKKMTAEAGGAAAEKAS
jgi:carbon monoxide dehydrogenase subunit G